MSQAKIVAVLHSARPFHMLKSSLLVLWGEIVGGTLRLSSINSTIALVVGACLWGGLYGLNDLYDVDVDKSSPNKRLRPLPRGAISGRELKIAVTAEISFALLCTILLTPKASLFALVSVINHLAYNVPPLRLKDRPVLDVLSGAITSQSCKLGIGIYNGTTHYAPQMTAAILFAVLMKSGFYLFYRLCAPSSSADHKSGTTGLLGASRSALFAALLLLSSIIALVQYLVSYHISIPLISVIVAILVMFMGLTVYFMRSEQLQASLIGYLVFSAKEPRNARIR